MAAIVDFGAYEYTRDKRMSMIGLALPTPSLLPELDATIDAADRTMLLYMYTVPLGFPVFFLPEFAVLGAIME